MEELIAAQVKRLTLTFAELPPDGAFQLEGVTEIARAGQSVTLEVRENLPQVLATAAQHNIQDIETQTMSLEEIFLAYYGKGNGGHHA